MAEVFNVTEFGTIQYVPLQKAPGRGVCPVQDEGEATVKVQEHKAFTVKPVHQPVALGSVQTVEGAEQKSLKLREKGKQPERGFAETSLNNEEGRQDTSERKERGRTTK